MKKILILISLTPLLMCSQVSDSDFTDKNSSKKFEEGEIFNLPSGFRGTVVIIFNQNDGDEKKYYNTTPIENVKMRVYNIPNNGVLKTKFSPVVGERPTSTIRVFYDFFDEARREEIKISGHDFIDEGYDVLKAQAFKNGDYCYPKSIQFLSFEVGTRFDFVDSTGMELPKWRDYIPSAIKKATGLTCEQAAEQGGQPEKVNLPK